MRNCNYNAKEWITTSEHMSAAMAIFLEKSSATSLLQSILASKHAVAKSRTSKEQINAVMEKLFQRERHARAQLQ